MRGAEYWNRFKNFCDFRVFASALLLEMNFRLRS